MGWSEVTLGFISCERLHYLRATLESARQCVDHPEDVQFVTSGDWLKKLVQLLKANPDIEPLKTLVYQYRPTASVEMKMDIIRIVVE